MGFFNLFGDNAEQKAIVAQDKQQDKQINFAREQAITQAATDPGSDQSYAMEQDSKSDLLRWQQELGDELFELVMSFKGFAKDEKDHFVQVKEQPICNDDFIYDVVIPQCRPFMSRNLINSKFDEARILNMLKSTSNDIANCMADGYDKYDIKFTDFDLIDRNIKNVIIAGAYRAFKGWTKMTDSTALKRIEAFHQSDEQQKPDGMLKMMGLKK